MKRRRNPQQTKKALLDALDRLVRQEPEHPDLKDQIAAGKEVKIHKSNVEKEAGLSNNAAKGHQDVLDAIEATLVRKEFGDSNITDDVVKRHPAYQNLKEKYDSSLEDRKKLRKQKKDHQAELERKDEAISKHLAHTHELLVSLWNAIPPQDVDSRMRAAKDLANVIDVNFNQSAKV
ncbi:conserved hypothetical protein [Vibrio harveyi]|uniref:hypothetical protein n=1 Tax=Vibrio TaxID=662 RepID=UPI0002D81996|nr:hypothetical protein [Vibrio anguillarum]CAH1545867.1 conserved hypothetical protein [Vibrio harveyi]